MSYEEFCAQRFKPVEEKFGTLDQTGIFWIIGFDCGGPLNFSTIGRDSNTPFPTYVSCELAVRAEQQPSSEGRFELMCHSNDEDWVTTVLTSIGRSSLETQFDHLHTVDISGILTSEHSLCGVILERFSTITIDGANHSILRIHGVTTDEMEYAMNKGPALLLSHLKKCGVYPNSDSKRLSTL